MKLPGPDHPITIARNGTSVRVTFAGRVIADTTRALILREAGYAPVFYIPRADTDMGLLQRSSHVSHCPYKGDASYFSISVDGRCAGNAAWSYEPPYPAIDQGVSGVLSKARRQYRRNPLVRLRFRPRSTHLHRRRLSPPMGPEASARTFSYDAQ